MIFTNFLEQVLRVMFVDLLFFLRYTRQLNYLLFHPEQWLKSFLNLPGFLVSELVLGFGEQD